MKILNIRGKEVEIDDKCVPLIEYFNSVGLDTKFCCEGHKVGQNFYIMFEDYITDEQMMGFLEKYSNRYDHSPFCGLFVKWYRKMDGEIKSNWMYIAEEYKYAILDKLILDKGVN
jgi:hypothetical protein